MKKIILLCSLFITSLSVNAMTDGELLKQKLAKHDVINAEFSQHVTSADGKLLNESLGHLSVTRPGKFRWEVVSPEEELIVSDGQTMWFYSPFIEQVTLINLSDAIEGTPFILLSGANDQQWNNYQVNKAGKQFIVTDKINQSQDTSFIFEFNKSGNVSKFIVLEELGQRSEFTLSHQPLKASVNTNYYSFEVPDGVEVDDQR
ncbi:MAG: outer membrane lipoprotein chaperone LolA [Psychromonas sp.]